MRHLALAAAAIGLVAGLSGRALFADGPAPAPAPTAEEQARIKQLVDNLGSDDFRIREAATKDLTALGEKARAALVEAAKSDVPEVRFRADQILRRLDGRSVERKLDTRNRGGDSSGGHSGWGSFGGADDDMQREIQKQIEEMQKRFKELEERWRREFSGGAGGGAQGANPWLGGWTSGRPLRALTILGRTFHGDGAELTASPRGARLVVTEDDVKVTYEAKTVDVILAKHPELASRPGVASVVEQAKKAEAETRDEAPRHGPGPGLRIESAGQSIAVEVTPGHAKVTVTEPDADGKPVSKTYEGADLDEIKREHPELADKIGGIHVGEGGMHGFRMPEFRFGGKGRAGQGKDEDGEDEDGEEDDEGMEAGEARTGPFGLGLRGATIVAVREGSDAAKAGLEKGDVVTSVNGTKVDATLLGEKPVGGTTAFAELVRKGREAGSLTFEVQREGKTRTLVWKR
jgi:hypothetical protein